MIRKKLILTVLLYFIIAGFIPCVVFSQNAGKTGNNSMLEMNMPDETGQTNNQNPIITAIDDISMMPGDSLLIKINASDPDGDSFTYSIVEGPVWMQFQNLNGLMIFIPASSHTGQYQVTVRVDDINGGFDTESFTLTVGNTAATTEILVERNFSVAAGNSLVVSPEISSNDPELYLMVEEMPSGAVYNSGTSVLSWTPAGSQVGIHEVVFSVYRINTLIVSKSVFINVKTEILYEMIIPSDQAVYTGKNVNFTVRGSYVDSSTATEFVFGAEGLPEGVVFDQNTGLFDWTPTKVGEYLIEFKMYNNNISESTLLDVKYLMISVVSNNNSPLVTVISPGNLIVTANALLKFQVLIQEINAYGYDYSVQTSDLPDGAVFDETSYLFNWVPANSQVGSYSIEFQVYSNDELVDSDVTSIIVLDEVLQDDWFVDSTYLNFDSMSVRAIMSDPNELLLVPGDMLAAFIGDKCGGVATAEYFSEINSYGFDLNIQADNPGAEVSLEVFQTSTRKIFEISETITFEPDADLENVYLRVSSVSGIEGGDGDFNIPKSFKLNKNYPNPFNPETLIEFTIDKTAFTSLTIFNVLGQKVKTLVSEQLKADTYSFKWFGVDEAGQKVASGMYFYRLKSGNRSVIKRMMLVK